MRMRAFMSWLVLLLLALSTSAPVSATTILGPECY
jgi:hypothetical protein